MDATLFIVWFWTLLTDWQWLSVYIIASLVIMGLLIFIGWGMTDSDWVAIIITLMLFGPFLIGVAITILLGLASIIVSPWI